MDDAFLYIWFKSERGDVIGQNQRGDSEVGHITKACSGLKSGKNENSKDVKVACMLILKPDQLLGWPKDIYKINHKPE